MSRWHFHLQNRFSSFSTNQSAHAYMFIIKKNYYHCLLLFFYYWMTYYLILNSHGIWKTSTHLYQIPVHLCKLEQIRHKKNVLYYFHSTRCHLVRLDNGGLEPEVENKSFDWSDVITWHSVCFSCCGVCKHCTFIWLNVAI